MLAAGSNGRHDVFVSYPHVDADAVRPLVGALRARGLDVWFDEQAIEDFTSITRSVEQGISRAKILIAYYSASYSRRRACQWELAAGFVAAQHAGDPRERVLVVNPEPGTQHIHPVELRDSLFSQLPASDDRPALSAFARSVEMRVARLDGVIGEIRPLSPPRWFGMNGVGSTRFVGRLRALWELHSALQASHVGLITGARGPDVAQVRGLGGIGKSLLAEEYALRFGAAYPVGVFWLRAFGNDDAKAGLEPAEREAERHRQLAAFATGLGLAVEGRAPEEVEGSLVVELEQRALPYLWVVDDVPSGLDGQELRRWFAPHPLGKTLVTTRSRDYNALAVQVEPGLLDGEEAFALLTSRRKPDGKDEEEEAWRLVQDLGRHALATDLAGAVLHALAGLESFATFRAALARARWDELELAEELSDALPNGHEVSITRTLRRSIEQLEEEGRDFLRLASALAVAPIPASLVKRVFAMVDLLDEQAATWRAGRALHQAEALSLTERTESDEGLRTVHTLVSRTVRSTDDDPERGAALRSAAVEVLAAELSQIADPTALGGLAFAAAHASELIGAHDDLRFSAKHARVLAKQGTDDSSRATLLGLLGNYDFARGEYQSAASFYRRQLTTLHELLGESDERTLVSMHNLALALASSGDLVGSRALFETVHTGYRDALGEEHDLTSAAAAHLAAAQVGSLAQEFQTVMESVKHGIEGEERLREVHRRLGELRGRVTKARGEAKDRDAIQTLDELSNAVDRNLAQLDALIAGIPRPRGLRLRRASSQRGRVPDSEDGS